MGKRSDFERIPRDMYPTPEAAVRPLLSHLAPGTIYGEPCAGDGRLVGHLAAAGHQCVGAWDIEPLAPWIIRADAMTLRCAAVPVWITNPPWTRSVLHPIIENLATQAPTWILFDADWMHTAQSTPYMPWCKRIVSIGRVKWIEGSASVGKDNCCWYLFDARAETQGTTFHGR